MLTGSGLAAKFTHAGTWKPVSASYSNGKYIGHIVPAFAELPVGPAGLPGIVITGWSYYDTSLPNGAPPVPVQVAVLEQQPDGTMRQATASLLNGASLINGAQTTVTGDFNSDGRTDALLLPYNEAPYTLTKGVILQANAQGGFDRVDLADPVIAHDAVLVTLNGTPTVLTTSWQYTPAHPSFVLDGKGGLTYAPQPRIGLVSHAASTAADFDGDGDSEIVFTDVNAAPNAAGEVVTRKNSIVLYETQGREITGDPIALPAPYFNERPQYAGLSSAFGTNVTHIPAIRVTDFNYDGKPDLVGLASLWPAEYNTLQMLQNTGSLTFSDVTDTLNPDFTIKSGLGNYNPEFVDIDDSGIETILLSGGVYNYTTTGHPNYILLNDGTGRLHVAFHKEFPQIALDVDDFHRGMMARGEAGLANGYEFGLGVFPAQYGNYHQFRPYVTAAGTINYLDVGILYRLLPGNLWDITYSFVNVPVGYDIRTDFTTPVTIADRNGTDRIRTFAGDDTIHRTGGAKTATVDGGLGTDRAIYTGVFADYALAATATGWTLADRRPGAPDGTDHLRRVELLQFADLTVGLGTPDADIVPAGPARLHGGAGIDSFAGTLARFHGSSIADLAPGETLRLLGTALAPAMLRLHPDGLGIDTDGDGVEEARIALAGHAPYALLPRLAADGPDTLVTLSPADAADPPLLWISTDPAPPPEGTASGSVQEITIHRAGDLSAPTTVQLAFVPAGPNPATASDFAHGAFPGGTVTLAPGQASLAVGVAIAANAIAQPNRTALATIQPVSGGTLAAGAALLTIPDDDHGPVLSIAPLDPSLPDGNPGDTAQFRFAVSRTGDLAAPVSVAWSVQGHGLRPAHPADFPAGVLPSGTLSLAAGQPTAEIAIPVAGSAAPRPDRVFAVTLAAPTGGATLATASAHATILADAPIADIALLNATTGAPQDPTPAYYDGPVPLLEKQLVLITPDSLTIAVSGPNWFLRTGAGNDALAAHSGTNVLDGGTGSNFLTGAGGPDTFFVDARGAASPTWSTANGFGPGDAATLWGIAPATHALDWFDNQGADGFKGLTLHASAPGRPTASLTLAGRTLAELHAKAIAVLPGTDPASGSTYIYITG